MDPDMLDSKDDQIIIIPNGELIKQTIQSGNQLYYSKKLDIASHKPRELRLKSGDLKKQDRLKIKKIIKIETKVQRKNKKRSRKCTTRIAELALPNKRQCLETKRTMWRVLSPYKLQNLNDTLTDARPLVSVSDAFFLFKCGPRKFRKRRNRKFTKKAIKPDDAKYMAALFGKNIYQNLMIPKCINLNPELTKLHTIVLSDLKELVNCKKMRRKKNKKYMDEISRQIVAWMSIILDEAYYRLVRDEIEDLDKEVHPLMDILYDVVCDKMHLKKSIPSIATSSSSLVLESLMESEQIVRKILKDIRKNIDLDDGETSMDFSEGDAVILEDADKLRTIEGKRFPPKKPLNNSTSATLILPTRYGSTVNLKLQIPNEHLLSSIDEPWPKDIPPLSIRPSATVIQSITSMGELKEADESVDAITDAEKAVNEIENEIMLDDMRETNDVNQNEQEETND